MWNHSTIQLWTLEDPTPPTSDNVSEPSEQKQQFILTFSQDNTFAAFSRLNSNIVTVINFKFIA